MSDHGEKPASAFFHEGESALQIEDWVEAIRSFLAAIQGDPRHAPSYLGLIRSYEAAADEYGDPELLEQASKVCRDALELSLDENQRPIVEAASGRIQERLEELSEEEDSEEGGEDELD